MESPADRAGPPKLLCFGWRAAFRQVGCWSLGLMLMGCATEGWSSRWHAWWDERTASSEQLCDWAALARQRGDTAQAARLLELALRRHARDPHTCWRLVEELSAQGKTEEAASLLRRMQDHFPHDIQIPLRLFAVEQQLGHQQLAQQALQRAEDLDPTHPDVLGLRAHYAYQQGHLEEALEFCYLRLQSAPDDLDTLLMVAEIHLQQGNMRRAAHTLRRVLEHPWITPEQEYRGLRHLGTAYASLERWDCAEECWTAALQLNPQADREADWVRLTEWETTDDVSPRVVPQQAATTGNEQEVPAGKRGLLSFNLFRREVPAHGDDMSAESSARSVSRRQ
ncbi:MAG: hypothetical protein KatS3mg114_0767 [Planctomycetaceae bacterium]|nr:MAG: hypothetical protein KatS3mg114_0767 [Planctomycetaceae bacterium]